MNTPIMKGRRCRKTFKKCLRKGKHYCVKHVKRTSKQKRCRKGTRRCADGLCHEV